MASLDSTPIASLLMLSHSHGNPAYPNQLRRSIAGYPPGVEQGSQGHPLFLNHHHHQAPTGHGQLVNVTNNQHQHQHQHQLNAYAMGQQHNLNMSNQKNNLKRQHSREGQGLPDIEHRRPPSPLDALVMALEVTEETPSSRNTSSNMVCNVDQHIIEPPIGYNMGRRNSSTSSDGDKKICICEFEGCNKQFMQLAHLRIHQRSHTGQRPYPCQFPGCDKAFTQLGNLKTHERKHTGERPYKCPNPSCTKTFTQLGNLKTHERIHASVKPFICTIEGCSKTFSQLGNLKTHQQKMHPNHLHDHHQSASRVNVPAQGVPDDILEGRGYQRTSSAREVQLLSKIKGIVAGKRRKVGRDRRWSETDGSDIAGSEGDII